MNSIQFYLLLELLLLFNLNVQSSPSSFRKRQVSLQNDSSEPPSSYDINFDNLESDKLIDFIRSIGSDGSSRQRELLSYDGWYHDVSWPDLGSKGLPLKKLAPIDNLPPSNASTVDVFMLSRSIFLNNEFHHSLNGKNLLSIYFGMFLLNDILDSNQPRCPPSYRRVRLPEVFLNKNGDEVEYRSATPHKYILLNKVQQCSMPENSLDKPPRKVNLRSVWLDGEILYGDSKFCSDLLRTFQDGKLIDFSQNNHVNYHHLFNGECFNYFGHNPMNENPFLLSIHFIWIRLHNLLAETISSNDPGMSDQLVYNEARRFTIALYQHVAFNEWIPSFLGENLPRYQRYEPSLDPQIGDLFETLANVYIYSLISPITFRLSTECSKNFRYSLLRTCNTYFDPFHHIRSRNGLEKLWTGLLLQSAQRDDHFIVEDVLTYSKGPLDFTRQDIIALLIQQSRDYQIPDYLTVRKSLGFDSKNKSYESFQQLSKFLWLFSRTVDPKVIGKMEKLYQNNINQIDLIVGALLENSGKEPSPMIKYLFLEQFRRIRDSDRFYFENDQNGQFSLEQIQMIKGIKFSDILGSVARITNKLIQPDAFLLPNDGQNPISPECFESLRKSSRFHSCQTIRESAHCFTLAYLKSFASLEKCTNGTTYDYFSGSEISFFLTIVIIPLFVVLLVILLRLLVNIKNQRNECLRIKVSKLRRMTIGDDCTLVQEWIGPNEGYRNTLVELNSKTKAIIVKLQYENRVVRCIYLKGVIDKVHVEISSNHCQNHLLIRVPKEYDLVLKFDSYYDRENFLTKLEAFLADHRFAMERTSKEIKQIFKSAFTKAKRQKQLEKFFRVVFSQAFNKKTDIESSIDIKTAKEIIETELTQFEFAEVLSMRPESTFVQQMFSLIDKDNNGYISFREFLDVIIIFAKGSAEQKIKIMFDMYDVNQAGRLSIDDFKTMIKSLLEIANQSVSPVEMNQTIHSMLSENGFTSKKELTFEDFSKLFHNYKEELGYTELNFDRKFHDMILIIKFVYWGRLMFLAVSNSDQIPLNKTSRRHSKIVRANETIVRAYSYFGGTTGTDFTKLPTPTFLKIETTEHRTEPDMFVSWIRFLDAKKKEIFFMALYNLIVVIIFLDKSYYYTYLNEASGLRQIVGYGVSLTRGSASVMMFTYSTILLTMCRNLITVFRETFLHQYIPFDGAVTFHKYIAFLALSMTILHSVGHISNFYHISTQRPSDLNCILSETYFNHDELPKFYNWSFGTLTGLTGFGLLFLILIIYIFAIPYSRHHIYNAFWTTHSLYPLFYGLMVLHGLGRLVQPPIFYFYFVIPLTLFTIDRLISASRKKIEISVVKATLHPSNVTHLEFKKPPNFDYKSGQWLRIACLGLNRNEYHPFTIASAPNESTLSLYIRAVGPFTKNIRQIYDHNLLNGRPYPKLFLDGPYGEGHQDWFRYDVSVLVGGGIGITPFASIIKDITFRSSINAKINCKRVYFLWVTRTQKHFEWMSDVIREAEEKDIKNLLVSHIFITQFYEKFDLRTTMLYICERHFQRISNKSLFTGLKAKTHFGRPNFRIFFESLQLEHRNVERVGVFSCGPNPMTNSVQQACDELNRKEGAIFKHHFENF